MNTTRTATQTREHPASVPAHREDGHVTQTESQAADRIGEKPDTTITPTQRKARVKKEGLALSFRLTDEAEINKLQELAAKDVRTPESYVRFVIYKHLMGHKPADGQG